MEITHRPSSAVLPALSSNHQSALLGKNQNTYEKHRREAEKKRKAEDKRRNKLLPKVPTIAPESPPEPPPTEE